MEIIYIKNPEELLPFQKELACQRVVAVDTETTGLDPRLDRLRLLQLSWREDLAVVIDCFQFLPKGRNLLKAILENDAVKVFQNAKFDLKFLLSIDIFPPRIFDTMLAGQLLRAFGGPESSSLASLARFYLNRDLDKSLQKSNWLKALSIEQIQYAAEDAQILLLLRKELVTQIVRHHLVPLAEIEFHCAKAIAMMEYQGILLDKEKWAILTDTAKKEKAAALNRLYTYTTPPVIQTTLWGEDVVIGDNFDSPPFILALLKSHGIQVSGTSRRDLAPFMAHPLVESLMAYRKHAKELSSFLLPMAEMVHPVTGRLHPSYVQIISWSGRMSSYSPNIQQIPRSKSFRSCFIAPKGRRLVIADYSQIELRVAAEISRDETMIEAYKAGADLHLLTAALVLNKEADNVTKEERQSAKAVNFGLIFGMGVDGLKQYALTSYGVQMSDAQARFFYTRFFQVYKGIANWHKSLKTHPPTAGYTLAGRRFNFSENAGLPGFCNMPVQGTAADIAKKALGDLWGKLIGSDAFIIAAVHDEIILECSEKDAEALSHVLKSTMEAASKAILKAVPPLVEVSVCGNWSGK